jgi:hypothetical protein
MTQDAEGLTSYSREQMQLAGRCEHGHGSSGSITGVIFSNQIFY